MTSDSRPDEAVPEELAEALADCGTFDTNSEFADEHFVLAKQLTPKRTLRTALLTFTHKQKAYYENKLLERQGRARSTRIENELILIRRIRNAVETAKEHPVALPSFKGVVESSGIAREVSFDPEQALGIYGPDNWEECKQHLLSDLDALVDTKRAEAESMVRGRMHMDKLMEDARRSLEWYEKKIPELKAAADASPLTAEEEEPYYWDLYFKRHIKCNEIGKRLGVQSDMLEAMMHAGPGVLTRMIAYLSKVQKEISSGLPIGAELGFEGEQKQALLELANEAVAALPEKT